MNNRHFYMLIILIFTLLVTACSKSEHQNVYAEKYEPIVQQAKDLDAAGKTSEALDKLNEVVGDLNADDFDYYLTLVSKDAANLNQSTSQGLEIANSEFDIDGDYMYVRGSIKNNSGIIKSDVKLKAVYYDDSENVLDTDWTYVIDNVGLNPNESKKFEIMTKKSKGVIKYRLEFIE